MPDVFLRPGEPNPNDVKLRDPTLADSGGAGQTVEPALLGGSVLFAPTLTPGNITISPDLLGGSTLFAPVVTPGNVTVSPALLGGGVTFAPALNLAGAFPVISQPGTIFAPTVNVGGVTVQPGLLGGAVLVAPSVGVGGVVISPALLGGATTSEPTIAQAAGGQTVSPGLLGGYTLFGPALGEFQTVSVPLIQGIGGFDPGAFDPEAFDGAHVFAPTLTVGSAPVDHVEPAPGLWQPRFAYDPDEQLIAPERLGRGRVFAPLITAHEPEDWVIDPRILELVLA